MAAVSGLSLLDAGILPDSIDVAITALESRTTKPVLAPYGSPTIAVVSGPEERPIQVLGTGVVFHWQIFQRRCVVAQRRITKAYPDRRLFSIQPPTPRKRSHGYLRVRSLQNSSRIAMRLRLTKLMDR